MTEYTNSMPLDDPQAQQRSDSVDAEMATEYGFSSQQAQEMSLYL